MRAVAGVVVAVVLVVCGGCILITGGTGGYSSADTGASEATCTSAANCGDGGMVCCLVVTASTTSTSGTCQPTCTTTYTQLCATTAECGEAGACSMQACMLDAGGTAVSFTLQACGTVPFCTAP
jgi:hypothetical protein